MRKQILVFCGVGVLVCLLLLLFWPTYGEKAATTQQDQALAKRPSVEKRPKHAEGVLVTNRTIRPGVQPVEPIGTGTIKSMNVIGPDLLANWQVPIDFYGKVVDQEGKPIAGANIHFHWVEFPDENGNRSTNTESDAEGLFSLRGVCGPILTVLVSKEGYYPRRGGAHYGPLAAESFSPDPQNPVVFRLRKRGTGVELITSDNGIRPNLAVRVPKDGTPVRVDFFEKRVSPTGQLEISQNKPPWGEAKEWSFRLCIPDGGFVENNDEFQFEAPVTGYVPTVEYRFRKGEVNWATQVNKQFYIVFGHPPRYGWLRIESNLTQETVFLTYAINPTGSRNLEPKE